KENITPSIIYLKITSFIMRSILYPPAPKIKTQNNLTTYILTQSRERRTTHLKTRKIYKLKEIETHEH
ncbi:hypothetical protein, partial [Escherichia coli]|uniref:hypothetical protein n=1 Tax=Escherichia coli TaxID=562 RepID=UPI001BAF7087